MTIILICIAVALVLAVAGALLLRSGAREERGLVPAQAPGAVTPRVRRRPPAPEPEPAPPLEPATAAAQVAAGAHPDEVRAAGHARLEAALARARARLEDERKAPQS
jgi:hypothetical protein